MTPITTTAELEGFCAKLDGRSFVAVDTEFMREPPTGQSFAWFRPPPRESRLSSTLCRRISTSTPFLAIMRDQGIEKVFHAARQDVEILNNLGAMPQPLFDTQIAGMAAGFSEQVAYDVLVRQMLHVDFDKSHRFTDWARRPLSEAQLTYALADVTHLAELYPILRARLEESDRLAWVREEMAAMTDPDLYDIDTGERLEAPEARAGTGPSISPCCAPLQPGASAPPSTETSPAAAFSRMTLLTSWPPRRRRTLESLDRLRSLPKGFAGSRFGAGVSSRPSEIGVAGRGWPTPPR